MKAPRAVLLARQLTERAAAILLRKHSPEECASAVAMVECAKEIRIAEQTKVRAEAAP